MAQCPLNVSSEGIAWLHRCLSLNWNNWRASGTPSNQHHQRNDHDSTSCCIRQHVSRRHGKSRSDERSGGTLQCCVPVLRCNISVADSYFSVETEVLALKFMGLSIWQLLGIQNDQDGKVVASKHVLNKTAAMPTDSLIIRPIIMKKYYFFDLFQIYILLKKGFKLLSSPLKLI